MADSLAPARIKRCGKDWYMPRRTAESNRLRDQELLSQIPSVSREQVERDLAAIKIKREEEMGSGGSSTDKRARCKRNGRDIYLFVRTSAAVREKGPRLVGFN